MLLHDLEERARAVTEASAFDYVAGGADDEITLAANVSAWDGYRLRPRVLRDVAVVDTTCTVLGQALPFPVLVAPTAYHALMHPDGETATARGVAAAGSVMTLSTTSSRTIEQVAEAAPDGRRWFQLYVHADRELTMSLVARAEAAGYGALVLTVDTPILGRRRRHGEAGFVLPAGVRPANLTGYASDTDSADIAGYASSAFDPSLTPEAIGWLAERTSLPVVVKGVLRGDDAAACAAAGAAAVIVSNHGGRQLDGVVSTAEALPDVVAAVAGGCEVYVDGGIRRGVDVLRALALGARAVFVGRPIVWGLALDGAAGVQAVLEAYRRDVASAFALAGVPSCRDATADLIAAVTASGGRRPTG